MTYTPLIERSLQQPDLNWEDAEVRKAIYAEAVTFWLERGVDGFRIDTSGLYSKFPFKDVPITDPYNYEQEARAVFYNGPRLHEFIRELNEETFSKYGAVTIAETPGNTETADMLPLVAAKERKYDMAIRCRRYRQKWYTRTDSLDFCSQYGIPRPFRT